jgi:hypothetical protein
MQHTRNRVATHMCAPALPQELECELAALRQELAAAREVAARASGTWDKFRKERDFHRMHHKRVAQEKNKLIGDIKRLKVCVCVCVLACLRHDNGCQAQARWGPPPTALLPMLTRAPTPDCSGSLCQV